MSAIPYRSPYRYNEVPAKSWDEIERRFQDTDEQDNPMVELIKHIKQSKHANRLFAFTSLYILKIGNVDPVGFNKEVLNIYFDHRLKKWHFTYFAAPFMKSEFDRIYPQDKGIEKFENFLKMIGW